MTGCLDVRPGSQGTVEYVLDCEHGTTSGTVMGEVTRVPAPTVVELLVSRHELAERCGCALRLALAEQPESQA